MPPVPQPPEGGEAPAEGAAPATPETPTAPPPDYSRIHERMDEMSQQQQALTEQFSQWFEQQQPEEEPPYYDLDEETGQLTPEGVQAVYQDTGRRIADERFDERMAEWQAEQARERAIEDRDDDWDLLRERIPELGKPEISQPLVQAAGAMVASAYGEEATNHPILVRMIELLYKEAKFDESAAAQTPAGPGVVLESAQGAAQPTKGSEVDWSDRIVKAAERLRPQI